MRKWKILKPYVRITMRMKKSKITTKNKNRDKVRKKKKMSIITNQNMKKHIRIVSKLHNRNIKDRRIMIIIVP